MTEKAFTYTHIATNSCTGEILHTNTFFQWGGFIFAMIFAVVGIALTIMLIRFVKNLIEDDIEDKRREAEWKQRQMNRNLKNYSDNSRY